MFKICCFKEKKVSEPVAGSFCVLVSWVTMRQQRKWKVQRGTGGRGISKSGVSFRGEKGERITPLREGREETETWDGVMAEAQEKVGGSEDVSSLGLSDDFKEERVVCRG